LPSRDINKLISAKDLALFRDEVKSSGASGYQISFSFLLVTSFEERAAEGSQ